MATSKAIDEALKAPVGARFFKCALQVNPYQYVVDNAKTTAFKSEKAYNVALVDALLAEGIEVIAITDHFRIARSQGLWRAARTAGIVVLPGFEAVSKRRGSLPLPI